MKTLPILLAAIAVAALLLFASKAGARTIDNTAPEDPADELPNELPADDGGGDTTGALLDGVGLDGYTAADPPSVDPYAVMESNAVAVNQEDTNCTAFLAAISDGEGTSRADDPYRVCYAYKHTVQDLAYHPAEWRTGADGAKTREWGGEPLDKLGAKYVGKVSTASGRYQIILPTWLGCKKKLALPDFSPDSQDKAALYLIRERGALDAVKEGQLVEAIDACARKPAIWASLPGANVEGQPMRNMGFMVAVYTEAGGEIA